ncbi:MULTISPECIES: alpha/beta fold hydrolase [unclassified Coleofasciculus]|uniref:alpha/beta fold hydrolase n=1 Tax=unclassified Coleofasciculus TaxID=2692782 RepID=UPI00187FBC41|nr:MULTISPECIES: alpha/beta hydrolase [unclassified Coleofasciculus]MBE9128627.1 alpha/beta hydrolase [Coleofasciculus sp. LEGE 07081]MBE9147267.1 alpha/beta hydrolase [Coleofasciculus sp. LEGE 07092]
MAVSTQSTATPPTSISSGISGVVQRYLWNWEGRTLTIAYETLGEGTPVLLLPSFSTVSTRGEMGGLAKRLSSQFQTVTLDWLGFGQSDRPPLDYQPALYHQLLQDFVRDIFDRPIAIAAAGHSAGYAMELVQKMPQSCSRIILVAPTWRGPLPTMGVDQQLAGWVRQLVRSPILGQTLYKLNTLPSFLRFMYKRHVYVDDAKLTPEFIAKKWLITQQPGARYAPAAFVTGAIDPVCDRSEFLAWFQPAPVPVMLVVGEQSPSQSKAEMNALAELTGVEVSLLPGSLGMHEEYAEAIADRVLEFLGRI